MLLTSQSWGDPEGPLALFLHGAASNAESWGRAAAWFGDRGWHAVAVDLRGHGGSPAGPRSVATLQTVSRDVLETIESFPGSPTVDVLVGGSLGVVIGLISVTDRPSFARRFVMEEPPGIETVDQVRLAEAADALVASARHDPIQCARDYFRDAPKKPDPAFLQSFGVALAAVDVPFVKALVVELARTDMEDLLRRCRVPSLMLLGRDRGAPLGSDPDRTIPMDMAEYSTVAGGERARYVAALTNGAVLEFETGHALHQQAFDEWAAALDRWLGQTQPI
jgi:pimeloyl-ACP methyl ester carboxylesterase